MARRKRRKFTAQFKADAVGLVMTGGKTIAEVTEQFDLTETALREWVRRAEVDAGKGPPDALTTAERDGADRAAQAGKALGNGARDIKKSDGLLRQGEHVKFAFIDDGEGAVAGRVALCEVLEVSRSGYYAWRRAPGLRGPSRTRELVVEIKAAHKVGRGAYGSPRVHPELLAKRARAWAGSASSG